MRLREIKPNEVICCKSIEEMQTLIDYFKINADAVKIWNYKSSLENDENRRDCLSFGPHGKYDGFCGREYYEENGRTITEFSDLIVPELSAEEVLRICHEICRGKDCAKCEMGKNCYAGDEPDFKKVVEICEQWKADHEKKEPELEWVDICRIIEIQSNGFKKCVHELDLAIEGTKEDKTLSDWLKRSAENELNMYISSHNGNYIAVVERVCRVKKGD